MSRAFAFGMVLFSIGLINGCSKCSREETYPLPPPSEPAVEEPQQAPTESSQHVDSVPSEKDPEQEPPQPATPAFPDDEGSGEENPD